MAAVTEFSPTAAALLCAVLCALESGPCLSQCHWGEEGGERGEGERGGGEGGEGGEGGREDGEILYKVHTQTHSQHTRHSLLLEQITMHRMFLQ